MSLNAWWKLRHDRLTIAAFIILVILAVLSAGADFFAENVFKYSFEKQDLLHTYEKPALAPSLVEADSQAEPAGAVPNPIPFDQSMLLDDVAVIDLSTVA